jgi:hypothetical protein
MSNGQGAGDGTVRSFSFVLFAQVNINAATLLSNTDWFVRTQSTTGTDKDTGNAVTGGSAKTTGSIGVIPACELLLHAYHAFGCCLLLPADKCLPVENRRHTTVQ